MKIAIFWKMLKTTQLWPTTVTKPLNQNWILRYQWKDHIHIFHLVPCAWNSVHWICLSDNVKIVALEGKRAKLSDTSISYSLSLPQVKQVRRQLVLELPGLVSIPIFSTLCNNAKPHKVDKLSRVFCSTIFRQFRQVNCWNSELDKNFGWVRLSF